MHPVLVAAERRIGGVGPAGSVASEGVLRSGKNRGVVAGTHETPVARLFGAILVETTRGEVFGAASVIGKEQYQGVALPSAAAQGRDDIPDAPVHARDLGGIHLHA